ncbi:MAG: type II secretion system GspH family protein [Desulfobulbaceae bacterium]|nr:type II secretion system GspH family protein [Desulfobulbaceae bacterium]
MPRLLANNAGVTLIEIIAVLVILGVVAAVAADRFTSSATYSVVAQAETLKTHLRYAQFRAMSDDLQWQVVLQPDSYTLQRRADGGNWVNSNLPDDPGTATHIFTDGVSMTSGDQTITFDQWGSPTPLVGPASATITVTLTGGGEEVAVVVTKNTGFIP